MVVRSQGAAVAPGPPMWLEGARYCAILRDIARYCAILCDTFRYLAINHELSKILAKAGLDDQRLQHIRNGDEPWRRLADTIEHLGVVDGHVGRVDGEPPSAAYTRHLLQSTHTNTHTQCA